VSASTPLEAGSGKVACDLSVCADACFSILRTFLGSWQTQKQRQAGQGKGALIVSSENGKSGEPHAPDPALTDQTQLGIAPGGAELEIQHIVDADIAKWRAARQQTNPHCHITVAVESDMRRCATELERSRRGLPLTNAGSEAAKPSFRVLSLPEFESQCSTKPESFVVEGLFPESSVNIAAGDSGLGKSPWAYQMALCVASGIPFLGHQVKQGPVLYVDLENGQSGILGLVRSLLRHLRIAKIPENFYLLLERDEIFRLEQIIAAFNPVLVIVDSLRAFRPDAEQKNENAASLMNYLRGLAKANKVTFLIIHHIKKPSDNVIQGALEDTPTMTWLLQACGARALINQTDVRIAFDAAPGLRVIDQGRRDAKNVTDDISLILKGFARLSGEFGPMFLKREFDEEGVAALGYRPLIGLELLSNPEQEAAFRKLPKEFSFTQARQAYGRRDQATSGWLQKLQRIGVLKHVKGGPYTKTSE